MDLYIEQDLSSEIVEYDVITSVFSVACQFFGNNPKKIGSNI